MLAVVDVLFKVYDLMKRELLTLTSFPPKVLSGGGNGTERPEELKYGILIDTTKCTGCRICYVACKLENKLPAEEKPIGLQTKPLIPKLTAKTWTAIKPVPLERSMLFVKLQCMQCDDPTCTSVCPTKAVTTMKHNGSPTTIDTTKCFGCKYCIIACPFHTPNFDPDLRTSVKCTLCADRIAKGLRPACFEACPVGAIKFGRRERIKDMAMGRAKEINGFVYGLRETGGTGILTVLPAPPKDLGLTEPDEKLYTSSAVLRKIMIQTGGLATLAIVVAAFIVFMLLA